MKKFCISSALFMLALCLAAREPANGESAFDLSSSASLGLLSGRAEKIVYMEAGSRGKLSQLLWHMKPLVYIGSDLNLDWQKPENNWGLYAGFALKYGLPMKTGIMEDRDWTGSYYGSWLPDFLTHYSVHDNKTTNAVLINAGIGASFKVFEKFVIKGIISYDFMTFSWAAMGGSFLYPDNDLEHPEEDGHGYLLDSEAVVGTYKQSWHIISPGVSFYGEFNDFFGIELSLKMSPFIWCNAFDEHLMRDLTIEDKMNWGFFAEPKLVFSFNLENVFNLALTVSWTAIGGTRGDSEYTGPVGPNLPNGTYTYTDTGGAGYRAFDIGLRTTWLLTE